MCVFKFDPFKKQTNTPTYLSIQSITRWLFWPFIQTITLILHKQETTQIIFVILMRWDINTQLKTDLVRWVWPKPLDRTEHGRVHLSDNPSVSQYQDVNLRLFLLNGRTAGNLCLNNACELTLVDLKLAVKQDMVSTGTPDVQSLLMSGVPSSERLRLYQSELRVESCVQTLLYPIKQTCKAWIWYRNRYQTYCVQL